MNTISVRAAATLSAAGLTRTLAAGPFYRLSLKDNIAPERQSMRHRYFYTWETTLAATTSLTGEQLRAARASLRWEQKDVAKASKVSEPTVKRLESMNGYVRANTLTVEALIQAFDAAGIEFVAADGDKGPGMRFKADLKPAEVPPRSPKRPQSP